jgi:hypothetical protein
LQDIYVKHYPGLGEEEGFVGRMKGLAVHVFFETSSCGTATRRRGVI